MIIVCPKVGLSKGEGGDGQASGSGDLKERLGAAGPPLPFTAKDIDMQIQRQNRHPSVRPSTDSNHPFVVGGGGAEDDASLPLQRSLILTKRGRAKL